MLKNLNARGRKVFIVGNNCETLENFSREMITYKLTSFDLKVKATDMDRVFKLKLFSERRVLRKEC